MDTITKNLRPSQVSELKRFGGRVTKFGVNFAVCDADGDIVLLSEAGRFKSEQKQLMQICRQVLNQASSEKGRVENDIQIYCLGDHKQFLTAVLNSGHDALVALIDTGPWSITDNTYPSESNSLQQQLVDILKSPSQNSRDYLIEMLRLLAKTFQTQIQAEQQIEKFSTELAWVYEELVLLHKLGTNMKLTEPDANFLQMACDSLTNLISVEGIAILLEKNIDDERRLVVAAGSGLIDLDERMASILYSRLVDEINSGKDALLDSEVDSPFRYQWNDYIKSIIAVPLYGGDKGDAQFAEKTLNGDYIIGLMVAINRIDKPDFDSTDVKLFHSVANSCAVFIENGRLFKDLEELFIGSLKALTRSIDAKDKYTRGHSERVAFISRWLAEHLVENGQPLEEQQLHRIYLAGLLHDIGKIGIDEAVLRKEGKLTDQEMDRIREHPSIGAAILQEIKQMRQIIPGVLYHHERMDGKGYPNGLTGDEIPLVGKIVQLADSFDAMTSKRTYRDARTVEQALEEIGKGLGTQFDEKVARVFLNSNVRQLWDIIMQNSPDFDEIYSGSALSEYGTAAVGTLIR